MQAVTEKTKEGSRVPDLSAGNQIHFSPRAANAHDCCPVLELNHLVVARALSVIHEHPSQHLLLEVLC